MLAALSVWHSSGHRSFIERCLYVSTIRVAAALCALDPGIFCAGKTLLNLDTEDWGEIFIGCAGGGDSMITLPSSTRAWTRAALTLTPSQSQVPSTHSALVRIFGCM